MFNGTKLGIIRHTRSIWAAYVGNKKLDDSRSKREALKRIFEEIDMLGCFRKNLKEGALTNKGIVVITE
ncbi:MAG TPA: hypothetical protein VNK03_04750 [Gammaproteobacteria bacterium]|nr:hypothetical protein [Gammaproteobacteria bacterium]